MSSLYGTLTLYSLPVSRRTSVLFFPNSAVTPILEHGKTGLLFLPKNVEAISNALLTLITNQGLRKQLDTAAIAVREKWLWPKIVDQMKDIYLKTL